jgi:hypothetical protein
MIGSTEGQPIQKAPDKKERPSLNQKWGDKPERGIGETHSARGGSDSVGGAATLNGP